MALSGSVTTGYWYSSAGLSRGYKLSWSAVQSIANNTSEISWTLATDGTYPYAVAERTLYAVIAGNVVVNKTDRVMREAGTVASGSFTVYHASDGTFGFTASIQAAVYESSVNCTGSGTFALNQIPRQANLTGAPDFTDEDNPTIAYSNPAGSAVSSLQACISLTGSVDDIAYRDLPVNGSSYTFHLTDTERETLRNATLSGSNSRRVIFFVTTVIGGNTFWSTAERTFTVINAFPALTASVTDCNSDTIALTGDENIFVRYASNAAVSMTAEAKKGASIISPKITCGSQAINAGSGTLSGVDSGTFVFSVTDNRGNTKTETIERTLVEYVKPTCILNANAPNASGAMEFTISGICFAGSFGSVQNAVQAYYRYKEAGGSYEEWIAAETVAADGTYRASVSLTDLDYTKQYTFQAKVEDSLMTAESKERTVKTVPVFDWGDGDFNFNVPVTIQGTDVMEAIEEKQEALGFTPVQQGGGSGQRTNKVYIGWSGSRLKAQVDVTDLGNLVFDGNVCEYGTNSNGSYYKFPDGTLICAKSVAVSNYSCTAAWGALYDGPAIDLGSWPYAFAALLTANINWVGGVGGITEGLLNVTSTDVGATYIARGAQGTIDGAIHVIGIGRWK